MATPKTVQRQLEAAEAIQASIVQQANTPTEVVSDISQLEQAPAPAPTVAPPAPTPAPAPADDWQHKFKTLQGMYNAEVPQLRGQLKTYESQVTALTEQVRALTAAMAKAPPKEEPKGPTVDPRDASQFGEDLVEMVNRYVTQALGAMRSEFGQYASELDGRVAKLEQIVTGVSSKTAHSLEQMFYGELAKAHPDWEQVNESDAWRSWLTVRDDVTGISGQEALDDAYAKLDHRRVIAIFTKFKASQPKPQTLDSQLAPSTVPAGASVPTGAQPPKLISQKAVQAFYNDLAKGRYKGREAEAQRLEAEINQAAREGRIV